jgi:hypothetical protein
VEIQPKYTLTEKEHGQRGQRSLTVKLELPAQGFKVKVSPFWGSPHHIEPAFLAHTIADFLEETATEGQGFQRSVRPAILSRARLVRMLRPM